MNDPRIYPIWDGLVSFRPGQLEDAVQFLMAELCRLVGADHAVWTGTLRRADAHPADSYGGWRSTPARVSLVGAPDRFDPAVTWGSPQGAEPLPTALLRQAGTFRALGLRDALTAEGHGCPRLPRKDRQEAVNGVLVAFPVRADAESWFVFSRPPRLPTLTEQERDLLASALRGVRWFHRRLLLWHGIIPGRLLLTQTERRVLCHALDGASDKEVATRLASGVHTTREHIATLYKKFGVTSRAELLALWLGGEP